MKESAYPSVEIVLAAYNGGKYIAELLNSIVCQTYDNWKILVRDDGSSDNTNEIIDHYADSHPGKLRRIIDDNGNVGVIKNFEILLGGCCADYILLCDQDDFWMPDKIEKLINRMLSAEDEASKDCPILIYSDYKIVDEELQEVAPSFWRLVNIKPWHNSLNRLLVENVITGCTVMMNRKLVEMCLPFGKQIIMHDWWMGLVAALFGRLAYIEEQLVCYRQHDRNVIGARSNRNKIKDFIRKLLAGKVIKMYKMNRDIIKNGLVVEAAKQASSLLENYRELLNANDKKIIEKLIEFSNSNILKKQYLMMRYGFFRGRFLENIEFFFQFYIG